MLQKIKAQKRRNYSEVEIREQHELVAPQPNLQISDSIKIEIAPQSGRAGQNSPRLANFCASSELHYI